MTDQPDKTPRPKAKPEDQMTIEEYLGLDTDRSHLVRPTDPLPSHLAAWAVKLSRDRRLVLAAMTAAAPDYPDGFTRAEIAEIVIFGRVDTAQARLERKRVESIRRRVSDFTEIVEETGDRREGEGLLRLKENPHLQTRIDS